MLIYHSWDKFLVRIGFFPISSRLLPAGASLHPCQSGTALYCLISRQSATLSNQLVEFSMPKTDLSVNERKFVNEYVKSGRSIEAYKKSGFSMRSSEATINSSACRILKKPQIQEAIKKKLEIIERSSEVQIESKRVALWDIAQDGMQKIPLESDENAPVCEKMVDARVSVSAINELNKMDGHHAASKLHVVSESYTFDFGTDDSLVIDGESEAQSED